MVPVAAFGKFAYPSPMSMEKKRNEAAKPLTCWLSWNAKKPKLLGQKKGPRDVLGTLHDLASQAPGAGEPMLQNETCALQHTVAPTHTAKSAPRGSELHESTV